MKEFSQNFLVLQLVWNLPCGHNIKGLEYILFVSYGVWNLVGALGCSENRRYNQGLEEKMYAAEM